MQIEERLKQYIYSKIMTLHKRIAKIIMGTNDKNGIKVFYFTFNNNIYILNILIIVYILIL